MSNQFQVGKTYKFSELLALLMQATVQTEYKGEFGVFTVQQVDADGSAWTDDITSAVLTERCHIPANIAPDCTEIVNG